MQVEVEVQNDVIRELLTSAFEGGSNYWIERLDYRLGDGVSDKDVQPGGRHYPGPKDYWPRYCVISFVPGCAVLVYEQPETEEKARDTHYKPLVLDERALARGMARVASQRPHEFAEIVSGDHDASTADVFLQMCLLGDIVYG